MKIITFYDTEFNGKTGKEVFKDFSYKSCVLDFKNNLRINIGDVNINAKKVFYKDSEIDFNNYDKIIFNYGEDSLLAVNYLIKAKEILNICKINNKLQIYNNPENHSLITDTLITYDILNNCQYVKVPEYSHDKSFCENESNFPLIVSVREQSGGEGKYLIRNKEEMNQYDPDFFEDKFFSKFYNSMFPGTDYKISIRIFVFNNKLIDFVIRPSNDWNVHCDNQVKNKEIILYMNNYFDSYFEENKEYVENILNELYEIVGNGLYAHDCLFVENKLVFCELGYKTIDPKLIKFYNENGIQLENKICIDKMKVHETYKNLLCK